MGSERDDPRRSDAFDAAATARALLPPFAMRTFLAAAIALWVSASGVSSALAEPTADAEELQRQQDRVEKHLLRVQQERFEAKARGEDKKSLQRLEREFKRTYSRRNAVIEAEKQLQ